MTARAGRSATNHRRHLSAPGSIVEIQARHAIAQGAKGYAQQARGSRAVAVGLLQRIQNRLALDLIQQILQGPGGQRRTGSELRRYQIQISGLDPVAGHQRQGPFQHILQFADIARKGIALERGHRIGGKRR